MPSLLLPAPKMERPLAPNSAALRDLEAGVATTSPNGASPSVPPRLSIILLESFWKLFDAVVLFRVGTIYLHRLEEFAPSAREGCGDDIDAETTSWRGSQQKEWDRLSTTLALLGTMNAAIIKVAPDAGGLSVSLWLGAAGLSLCGVFMVQYFSIRAFPMANAQLRDLVSNPPPDGRRKYISRKVLALAISAPTLMALWSSILFVAGILIYIWEAKFDRTRYRVFALIPVMGGVLVAFISLILGGYIGAMMHMERSQEGIRRWRKHNARAPISSAHRTPWKKFKMWKEYHFGQRNSPPHEPARGAENEGNPSAKSPPPQALRPQQNHDTHRS